MLGTRERRGKARAEIISCPVLSFFLSHPVVNYTCRGLLWPLDPLLIHVISNTKCIQCQALCQRPGTWRWTRQGIHPWEDERTWLLSEKLQSYILCTKVGECELSFSDRTKYQLIDIRLSFFRDEGHMKRHKPFSKGFEWVGESKLILTRQDYKTLRGRWALLGKGLSDFLESDS